MTAPQVTAVRLNSLGGFIAADLVNRGDQRPWLVCLHGLQSNRQMFRVLLEDVRFADFNIIALDLIGFGDSSKPRTFDYDLLSQFHVVSAALKVQGIECATWIGHSLGGMIATLAAREDPSCVGALVSLEGNLTLGDCGKSAEVASSSFETFQGLYSHFIQEVEQEGAMGKLRSEWIRATPDYVFYQSSQSIEKWARSGELLREFESNPVPKLLLKGADGKFRSEPKGSSVTTHTVPRAGHFMMLDAPDAVLAAISHFISAQD